MEYLAPKSASFRQNQNVAQEMQEINVQCFTKNSDVKFVLMACIYMCVCIYAVEGSSI